MKRSLLCALCLLILAGCGAPQEELDAANAAIGELEAQLEDLKKENSSLTGRLRETKDRLEELEEEYEELKNGAANRLADIRAAFQAQNWKSVISKAGTLHEKFPGTDQDLEAQKLAADAQKAIDDAAAAEKAEAEKEASDRVRALVRITDFGCSAPNSAGGVSWHLRLQNMDKERTVKYARIEVCPYNAVGDPVACSVTKEYNFVGKITGPIAPGEKTDHKVWSNSWYNWSVEEVRLINIELEYTDGTKEKIRHADVGHALW